MNNLEALVQVLHTGETMKIIACVGLLGLLAFSGATSFLSSGALLNTLQFVYLTQSSPYQSDKPFIKICPRDHSNHRELFDVTLRLLVNLTNPELLLFKVLFACKLSIVRIILLS